MRIKVKRGPFFVHQYILCFNIYYSGFNFRPNLLCNRVTSDIYIYNDHIMSDYNLREILCFNSLFSLCTKK